MGARRGQKTQAIASYAKQADDKTLLNCAVRIQARAVRRCGELLQVFQTGAKGGRPHKNGAGGRTVSQRQAAKTAGLSDHQERQAINVANVPADDFDAAVESDEPPTITNSRRTTADIPNGMTADIRNGIIGVVMTRGA